MKRSILAILGVIILAGSLGLREWLVNEEIESTQAQLKSQLNEIMKSANNRERLNELSSSSTIFEKFIAPVIEATNHLLWPSSRMNAVTEWARGIHQDISKAIEAKNSTLKTQYEKEIQEIRESSSPSVDRMLRIVKKAEDLNPNANISEIAANEMKALKEMGQKRDDATLSLVKEEGIKRLQQLRKILKKADQKHMGEYLSSGRFVRDIQQPAVELILQIRQEDIRKQAWQEFRSRLNDILAKRGIQLKNHEQMKKRKEIEKLFDEPMAQLFEQEDRQALPFAAPSTPPPSAAIPQEQNLYNELDPSNPSDAANENLE